MPSMLVLICKFFFLFSADSPHIYVYLSAINIHPGAGWFVVTSGAILGVTAAFLWTAQGSLMLSYCTEAQKGLFISIFWAIFNLGAVVGSVVSFGQNFRSTVGPVKFNGHQHLLWTLLDQQW
jgi:MFS family permease